MNLNGAYPYRVQYEDPEDKTARTWAWCLGRGEAISIAMAMNHASTWRGKFFVYDVKEGKRI